MKPGGCPEIPLSKTVAGSPRLVVTKEELLLSNFNKITASCSADTGYQMDAILNLTPFSLHRRYVISRIMWIPEKVFYLRAFFFLLQVLGI
jgi:hypothetical protein